MRGYTLQEESHFEKCSDSASSFFLFEFQNLVTRDMLAKEKRGNLTISKPTKSSALAAIDFIVSLSSNVFIPSHGGNMDRR